MEDYYQILSVSPNASQEEIKERFRFLAHAYHPDRFATLTHKQYAEEAFKKVNEAYHILSNSVRRAQYDRQRSSADSRYEEERRKREAAETAWRHAKEEAETARRHAEEERRKREETEAALRRAHEAQQQREEAEAARHRTAYTQRQTVSYIICLKCYEENASSRRHCVKCGQNLHGQEERHKRGSRSGTARTKHKQQRTVNSIGMELVLHSSRSL